MTPTQRAALRELAEKYRAIPDNPVNWTSETFYIADKYSREARAAVPALLATIDRLRKLCGEACDLGESMQDTSLGFSQRRQPKLKRIAEIRKESEQ